MVAFQAHTVRAWVVLGIFLCSSAADPRRLSDSTECDAPCQPGQFKALPLVALCGGGGCTVEDDILKGKSQLFMQIPINSSGIRVEMTTRQTDQDLQLVDPAAGICVAGAVGDTCPDGGRPANAGTGCTDENDYCVTYEGMNWYFSGDKQLAPVFEKLSLQGRVTQLLDIWVEAPSGGELQVQVRNDPISPCPTQLPGCVPCEQYDRCGPFDKKICDGSAVVVCEATTQTTTTSTQTSVTVTSSTSSSRTSSTTLSRTVTTKTATTTSTSTTGTSTASSTSSTTSYTDTTTLSATSTSTTTSRSTSGSSTSTSATLTSTSRTFSTTTSTSSAETETRTSSTSSSKTLTISSTTSQTNTNTHTVTTSSTSRTATSSSSLTTTISVSMTTTRTTTATLTSETSTSQTSTLTVSRTTTSSSSTSSSTTSTSLTSTSMTGTSTTSESSTATVTRSSTSTTVTGSTTMSSTLTLSSTWTTTSTTSSLSVTSQTDTTTATNTLTTSSTLTRSTVTTTSITSTTLSVTTTISSTTLTSTTSSSTETCGCCASCSIGVNYVPPGLAMTDEDNSAVALSVVVPVILVLLILMVLLVGWVCKRCKAHQEMEPTEFFSFPTMDTSVDANDKRHVKVGPDDDPVDSEDPQELLELRKRNQSLLAELSSLRVELAAAKKAAAEPAAALESHRAKQEVMIASWRHQHVQLQGKVHHLQSLLQYMIHHATELARIVQGDCAQQGKLHHQVAAVMQRIRGLQDELASPAHQQAVSAETPPSRSRLGTVEPTPSTPRSLVQEPVAVVLQEPTSMSGSSAVFPENVSKTPDPPPPPPPPAPAVEETPFTAAQLQAFRQRAAARQALAASTASATRLAAAAAQAQDHGAPFLPLLPSHVQSPPRSGAEGVDDVENEQDLRSLRDKLLRRHNLSPQTWNDRFRTLGQWTSERGLQLEEAQQALQRRLRRASLE
ncbi:unnamed protein product [Symbiodinium sp. CCMP2456]|nr:unnamed protein product [Symbiodinium sp. CCMP2456]